jgi:hypothetical protein
MIRHAGLRRRPFVEPAQPTALEVNPKAKADRSVGYRILLFAILAACGGTPSTQTPSPASDREVRLLDADDPALSPVMFAAAKYVFNPDSGRHDAPFGGVYVNKRMVPSLTREIARYVNWSRLDPPAPGEPGGIRFTSVRIASDTAYVEIQLGNAVRTWCVPFVVDQTDGGWVPLDRSQHFSRTRPGKTGQCGA